MNLGAFSLSLTVKDLSASKSFYGALGFSVFGGDESQGWLILKSSSCVLGLFQGMFDKNMMTFNPGWDSDGQPLTEFEDVREIQKSLKEQGIAIIDEADEATSGPASFIAVDPDGNPVLIDQHV